MIQIMLAISIVIGTLNLVLLIINLYLLRRGYGQQRVQVVIIEKGEQRIVGDHPVIHRLVTVGKRGTIHYFNGDNEATTILRFPELADEAGELYDIYAIKHGVEIAS